MVGAKNGPAKMMAHRAISTGKMVAIRTEPIESGVWLMALKDLEIRALKAKDRIYKKADERGLYRGASERLEALANEVHLPR